MSEEFANNTPAFDQQRNFHDIVAKLGYITTAEAPVSNPPPGRRLAHLPARRRTAAYWDAQCRPAGPAPPLRPLSSALVELSGGEVGGTEEAIAEGVSAAAERLRDPPADAPAADADADADGFFDGALVEQEGY